MDHGEFESNRLNWCFKLMRQIYNVQHTKQIHLETFEAKKKRFLRFAQTEFFFFPKIV